MYAMYNILLHSGRVLLEETAVTSGPYALTQDARGLKTTNLNTPPPLENVKFEQRIQTNAIHENTSP